MDIGKLIAAHMAKFRSKAKFAYPEEYLSRLDRYLSNPAPLTDQGFLFRKKIGRLRKRTVRYPNSNITGIKI